MTEVSITVLLLSLSLLSLQAVRPIFGNTLFHFLKDNLKDFHWENLWKTWHNVR